MEDSPLTYQAYLIKTARLFDDFTMKTYSQRKEDTQRGWRIVDANGKVLGRLASQVATIIRGKDKPTFTPHVDGGDFVVVINAEKIELTRTKLDKKMYYDHTRYRGGLKTRTARQIREDNPEEMITRAVWGMLPKGPLGQQMITKLKVYRGSSHPHAAQQPVALTLME